MDATHPRDVVEALSILTSRISTLEQVIRDLTTYITPPAPPPEAPLETPEDRRIVRRALEARAITLLTHYGPNRLMISRELKVPVSTLRYWKRFNRAYQLAGAHAQQTRQLLSAGCIHDPLDNY